MQLPALGASITRDGGLSMSGQSQNVSQPGRRVASDQVYYYIAYIDTHDRLITPLDRVKRGKNNAKTKIGDAVAAKRDYNYHLRKHCNAVNLAQARDTGSGFGSVAPVRGAFQ